MENFEQSEAHRVLAKAYSTMPVGEPSVHIKVSREAFKDMEPIAKKFFGIKPKPYQRDIIKLIESGKTKRLKLVPLRPTVSLKHKHLMDFIMDEEIQKQVKAHSADMSLMQTRIGIPDFIIIDDMEAPYRHAALNIKVQHECAIAAIKATTL